MRPPPWWWLRLRAAPPSELAGRLGRAVRRRVEPPPPPTMGTPRWPWAWPSLPVPLGVGRLFEPVPGGWQATWRDDPKPVWALHQGHALVALHQQGDPTAAARWEAAHPPGQGLLWASPHAVAGRVPALAALGRGRALGDHAAFLRRHPSLGTSANNHRVAELAALHVVAATLPGAPKAPPGLVEALEAQLHPDGWPREQSLAYLAHGLEWALIAHRLGAPGLAPALGRGLDTLLAVLADDGSAPRLGDDGGDEVLPGGDRPYPLDVAGCVAVALGRPAPRAWQPGLRAACLGLVDDGSPRATPPPSTVFAHGGLTVLRSPRWHALLDHGPLGMAPLFGHGHDDALATWAHLDGRPLFGGRGTSAYHDPLRRRVERGSQGHSALRVDGRDRSVPHPHPFLWAEARHAALAHVTLHPAGGRVQGTLDLGGGLRLRRTLAVDGAVLEVHDRIEGSGRHHVELRWHLAPGRRALVDGHAARVDGARLDSPLPLEVEVGAHAAAYGRTVPATTLVATGVVALPFEATSRWTAGGADEQP